MPEIDFTRVVSHLIAGELARLRHVNSLTGPLATLTAVTPLDEGGLGVDSLELLELAGAVNEMFHLHETSVADYLLQHRTVGAWAEVIRSSWEAAHEHLTFRTSGSTGAPKRCVHLCEDLWEEVAAHAEYFQSTERIFAFVPAYHIYGFLFTAMLPVKLGAEVIDCRLWPVAKLLQELRTNDLLVATPTFWEFLSRSVDSFVVPVRGVTSTAPCPPRLFERLQQQNIQLTEIYGSSETAGIARRPKAEAPFTLFSFWKREGNALLRVGRSTLEPTREEALKITPPDQLEWVTEREFHLAGRLDGAVQVGGVNVFPERIASRLSAHPSVRACAVRAMSRTEGNRLKAFVVWRNPEEAVRARESLEAWCRIELTPAERPVSITSGPSLPKNEWGKLTDWELGNPDV